MSTKKIKVKMQATEMVNADVDYISLVPKAASRIPFRVTKSEAEVDDKTEEIDLMSKLNNALTRAFKRDGQKSTLAPTVVGVAVAKSDVESFKPQLKELGLKIDNIVEDGDVAVFKQGDYDEDAVTIFKNDETNVATMVAHVQKSFDSWPESSDYMENLRQNGFMPSLGLAMDALGETVWAILYRTDMDKAEIGTAIDTAITDFQAYISTLVSALPEMAFKIDKEIKAAKEDGESGEGEGEASPNAEGDTGDQESETQAEGEGSGEGETEGANQEGESTDDKTETGAGDDAGAGSQESAETGEETTQESAEKGDKEAPSDQKASDAESGDSAQGKDGGTAVKADDEVPGWAKGLVDTVTSLKSTVDELATKSDSVMKKMDEVEEKANSAKDIVSGAVLGSAQHDTHRGNSQAKKSEGDDDFWNGALPDFGSK